MKYIKKYEIQRRGPNRRIKNYEFVIDVKNATDEDIELAFKEFGKYVEVSEYDKTHLTTKYNPWAWIIRVFQSFGSIGIDFNIITTRDWGIGDGGKVDDRITIKEFIDVGLEGVEELINSGETYFKIKDNANKYNL